MHRFLTMLACGAVWLGVFAYRPPARASDETTLSASDKPVLIVFLIADNEADITHETLFVQKLKLALDGFDVRTVDMRNRPFSNASLGRRLEQIQTVTRDYDAVASTWIEKPTPQVELLQLVAMSTGRALVQIVEVKSGPSSEAELAFAAQELLGEAYIFEPRQENEAVAAVVDRVKKDINQKDDREPPPSRFGVQPVFVLRGGLYGTPGSNLQVGGGLAAELGGRGGFFGRLSVAGLAGPKARFSDGVMTGAGIAPQLFFGYSARFGPVFLEPIIGIGFVWTRLDMALGQGSNQTFSWFSFRGSAGADIRLPIRKDISLSLGATIGGLSAHKSFRRLSDDSVITTTAHADWAATAGLVFRF